MNMDLTMSSSHSALLLCAVLAAVFASSSSFIVALQPPSQSFYNPNDGSSSSSYAHNSHNRNGNVANTIRSNNLYVNGIPSSHMRGPVGGFPSSLSSASATPRPRPLEVVSQHQMDGSSSAMTDDDHHSVRFMEQQAEDAYDELKAQDIRMQVMSSSTVSTSTPPSLLPDSPVVPFTGGQYDHDVSVRARNHYAWRPTSTIHRPSTADDGSSTNNRSRSGDKIKSLGDQGFRSLSP
jgi:hypothetical protein